MKVEDYIIQYANAQKNLVLGFLKKRGCYYEQKNKKYRSRTL